METRELGISGSERFFVGSLLRVGMLVALLSAGADAMVFTISTSLATSLLSVVFIMPDEAVTLGRGVGASVAGSTLASMHAVLLVPTLGY